MSVLGLIAAARQLPERLATVERAVRHTFSDVSDIKEAFTVWARRTTDDRKPRQAFVYLLPEAGPIFCQSAMLSPGVRHRLGFTSHIDMPPGIWVVVAGPAAVRGVRIGNQCQDYMTDFNGHVCKTRDAWTLGTYLSVELEAEPG
jgi:hypothetical protein